MEQNTDKTIEGDLIKIEYVGLDEMQDKIKKADALITELRNVLNEISKAKVEIQLS
jgi:hypothetical protein